jgi:glycine hydroxymethyltransferase
VSEASPDECAFGGMTAEQCSPYDPSGIRLGTPALTTRGMKEAEMERVADWIDQAVKAYKDEAKLAALHKEITAFAKDFPLPN